MVFSLHFGCGNCQIHSLPLAMSCLLITLKVEENVTIMCPYSSELSVIRPLRNKIASFVLKSFEKIDIDTFILINKYQQPKNMSRLVKK